MSDYNKVLLVGNLVRDPEVRATPAGVPVTTFRIGVHDPAAGQEPSTYLDVVTWESNADFAGRVFMKGTRVMVEGRLKTESWKTPKGEPRSKVKVVATSVEYLGGVRKDRQGQRRLEMAF